MLGLLVAKKAVAVGLYTAGSRYGWPRVYRRVLEANRRLTPAPQRAATARGIRLALVAPGRALEAVRGTAAYELASRWVEEAAASGKLGGVGGVAAARRVASDVEAVVKAIAELAAARKGAGGGGGGGGGGKGPHTR